MSKMSHPSGHQHHVALPGRRSLADLPSILGVLLLKLERIQKLRSPHSHILDQEIVLHDLQSVDIHRNPATTHLKLLYDFEIFQRLP